MIADERNKLTPEDVVVDLRKRGIDVRDLNKRRISLSIEPSERPEFDFELVKNLRDTE
jgi:hypothetical protein